MSTNWKKPLVYLGAAWAVLAPIFIIACNFLALKAKVQSDYMVSFYVAGLMVLKGNAKQIYPDASCSSWQAAPINNFAHAFFQTWSHELTANFMYSPLVAILMAPWSLLSPVWALTAWQIFNLLILLLSCILLRKCTERASSTSIFILCMSYAPIFATLWVGQTSIVFGLAPLAAACYFSKTKQALLSGLLLSLLILKPQFIVLLLLTAAFLPYTKKTLGGFLFGSFLLLVLNANVLSFATFLNWIHSLSLSEQFMGGQGYTMASYLAASLPSAILLLLAPEQRATLHWQVYGSSLFLALLAVSVALKQSCKSPVSDSDQSRRLLVVLFTACLAEVICAPRLVLYDLALLIPALTILYFSDATRHGKTLVIACILAVGTYTFFCLFAAPNPLVLVAILIITCLTALKELNTGPAV